MTQSAYVIGTAGHIDHGKTSLVKALTGIDTDRLAVEKERGITTELGFAHLDVGGRRLGFVDVPGHERFVRAMVAGAAGIDIVCFVVAADEGVMPQTREHLDICGLIGVQHGVIALTKIDLVDGELHELVCADIREAFSASFLADAPIVPCSTKTHEGIDLLHTTIERIVEELPSRSGGGALRLPIDRVFTMKGFGTVVTGTIAGGTIAVGEEVVLLPAETRARVRGLQVHGEAVRDAAAGTRCAINLQGVGHRDIERGDVVAHVDELRCSHIFDTRLHYLSICRRPLKSRERVLVHHGTTQVLGTITLLDGATLDPGQTAHAQLRTDRTTPLAVVPGDRFLVRGFEPQKHYGTTIGGGEVLRVLAAKWKRHRDQRTDLSQLAEAGNLLRAVVEVKNSRYRGLSPSELAQRLGVTLANTQDLIAEATTEGSLVYTESTTREGWLVVPEVLADLEAQALADLKDFGGESTLALLRDKLPQKAAEPILSLVIDGLARRQAIIRDGATVRLASHRKPTAAQLSTLAARVATLFSDAQVTPPRLKEVATIMEMSIAQAKDIAHELAECGVVVKVTPDLFFHAEIISRLRLELRQFLNENKEISPAQWKEITGASRKFSIPLAEYFDREKLTLRIGNSRKLRGHFQ